MLSRRLEVPFDRIKVEAALITFGYGVDIDATKGSSKIWMAPSVKMGSLEIIYSLTHLPQSVINTVEHFKRFCLHSFGLVGFDFHSKTINLYVMIKKSVNSIKDYAPLLAELGITPNIHLKYFNRARKLMYFITLSHGLRKRLNEFVLR